MFLPHGPVHSDHLTFQKKSHYSQNNLFKGEETGVHFSKDFMPGNWFFLKCGNQGVFTSYLKNVYYPVSWKCKVNCIKWYHKPRRPYFQGRVASFSKLLCSLLVIWSSGVSLKILYYFSSPPLFIFAVVIAFLLVGKLTYTSLKQANCGNVWCAYADYSVHVKESNTTQKYLLL